ncbi:uncharacterized protein LOC135585600 isoform X1 [Musa acuminata AAA Group]|uniref:uncharacterized protein LOC135585600 isoform X1 n=1 Tax=Musa acuminata AAA Group TaxID=214697 RepID=UPI0031D359A2
MRAATEKKDPKDRERVEAVLGVLKKQAPLTVKQEKFCSYACVERFLRAEGDSVKKVAKRLRAVLSWRESIGTDHLIADEFYAELADGMAFVAGHDDEARPVMVFRIKQDYLKLRSQKSFLRLLVFTLEVAVSSMARNVDQFVLLFDASYFRSPKSFLQLFMGTLKIISDYYPGRLHKAFVIDPPSLFSCLWKVYDLDADKIKLCFSRIVILVGRSGRSAVRRAVGGHGGGVVAGLRGLARGRILHVAPADGLLPLRSGCGQSRQLRVVPVLLHRFPPQLAQAMVPEHHHHHQERRGAHGQPLPNWRLPAQRPVVLLCLLGPPVDALGRHCRRGHQPEHTVHSFLSSAMQAASAAAEDADAVVLSVSGNAVLVQERGAPEQSGEGARIVSAVPEILPAAIRRGGVPSQHAAAAQRPHLHRLPP